MPLFAPSASAPKLARLEFTRVDGRTNLLRAESPAPLKILQPKPHGDAAWACLSSLGGGLVDGDHISIDAVVGAGASGAITTQASTKVYRGRSSQLLAARVEKGGLLVSAPDPVVCYAGARYTQRQSFELEDGASLCAIDWLSSGRSAHGERWRFASYEARLRVAKEGKDLLVDALRLDPEAGPLPERLGRWELLAVAVVDGPRLALGIRELLKHTKSLPLGRRAPMIVSVSALGETGALVRLSAESIEQAAQELRRRLDFVWAELGDDPWSFRY